MLPLNPRLNQLLANLVTKFPEQANTQAQKYFFMRLFWTRRLTENIYTLILIYAGYSFYFHNYMQSPIWPFTGVALSALFLRGNAVIPAIFIGVSLSYFMNGFDAFQSLYQGGLLTTTVFLIRYCSIKWDGAVIPFFYLEPFFKWLICTIVFCAAHVYLMGHHHTQLDFLGALFGELNGILCLTPLSLIFSPFMPSHYFKSEQWAWMVLGLAILLLQSLYFFIPGQWIYAFAGVNILLLAFYARFEPMPVSLLLLALSVIYLGGTRQLSMFQHSENTSQFVIVIGLFCLGAMLSLTLAIAKQSKEVGVLKY